MKSIKLFLLSLVLLLCATAKGQDSVKVWGNVQNKLSDTVEVSYNGNNLAYYPEHFVARVDKKGNFSVSFPFPKGIYVQSEIRHGNHLAEVLLHAGDKLQMTVDTRLFDSTIHYKGPGSEVQNFIALHTITKGRMNQYTTKVKEAINEEPDTFLKAINVEYRAEMKFLNDNGANLPASFKAYWETYYKYYNYFFMQQYPQTHQMIKVRRYTDTVPEENYVVVKEMPLAFNDTFLQVPTYLLYLTGVFESKLKAAGYTTIGKDTLELRAVEDSLYNVAFNLLPDHSAEFYMAQNLYGRARSQRLDRTLNQLHSFKKQWPKSTYLPLLTSQVAMAEKLSPGHLAPDINIVTPEGKHIKLSDLRGKVVYLGFWAGWCRQCVGEMIAERKIKDLLHKRPVEFVYVSLSDDTATERMLTSRYKMEGIYTTAKGGWDSKEVKAYGVQGLPAYFLIDEQGKFVKQYTPTPMQTMELVMEIEKLFK